MSARSATALAEALAARGHAAASLWVLRDNAGARDDCRKAVKIKDDFVDAWATLGLDFPEGAVPVAWGETCGCAVERLFGRKACVMDAPSTDGLLRTLLKITRSREGTR